MALTFSRWVIAVIVVCAAIAAWLTKEPERHSRQVVDSTLSVLETRMNAAQRRAATVAAQVRLLRVRDSVQAKLAAMPAAPALVVDPIFPSSVEATMKTQLAARAAVIGNASKVPVTTAVVLDTGRTIDGAQRIGFGGLFGVDFVLPEAAGKPCLTLVRVDAQPLNFILPRELGSDFATARFFGPCAFYEAFGAPGPGIAPWLASRGWGLAQAGDWSKPVRQWSRNGFRYGSVAIGVPITTLALRDEASADGARCAAGDAESCTKALMRASVGTSPPLWGTMVPTRIRGQLYDSPEYLGTPRALGPHEITYLADLVHGIGPEKFARFWQSSLPPVEAFREATGGDLGEWTREWAGQAYGVERGRGPSTSAASVWFAVAILLLGGGLAMRATARRQVAA